MDVKETLKNLHRKFPNYTLDELFDILDCVVSNYYVTNNTYGYTLTCDSTCK